MVLDASTAAPRVLCIYPWDGNSMAKHCNGNFGDGHSCIPGELAFALPSRLTQCLRSAPLVEPHHIALRTLLCNYDRRERIYIRACTFVRAISTGCSPVGAQCQSNNVAWGCSYPPERLDEALRHHTAELVAGTESKNNEVILDTRWLSEQLPGASRLPSPVARHSATRSTCDAAAPSHCACYAAHAILTQTPIRHRSLTHNTTLNRVRVCVPRVARVLRSSRLLLCRAWDLQPDRWEVDLRQGA